MHEQPHPARALHRHSYGGDGDEFGHGSDTLPVLRQVRLSIRRQRQMCIRDSPVRPDRGGRTGPSCLRLHRRDRKAEVARGRDRYPTGLLHLLDRRAFGMFSRPAGGVGSISPRRFGRRRGRAGRTCSCFSLPRSKNPTRWRRHSRHNSRDFVVQRCDEIVGERTRLRRCRHDPDRYRLEPPSAPR